MHPDGDAELFLVKLEPKPVLQELRKELEEIEAEKVKLANKKQDKRHLIKLTMQIIK